MPDGLSRLVRPLEAAANSTEGPTPFANTVGNSCNTWLATGEEPSPRSTLPMSCRMQRILACLQPRRQRIMFNLL